MTTYNLLITGAVNSGKYGLLLNLSNRPPQIKTLKFKDEQGASHVVDLAYQEVQLAQSTLCVYIMSDELVRVVQNLGFLSTLDAIILCVDAQQDDVVPNLREQLEVICGQGMGECVSIRMKTCASLAVSVIDRIIATADQYHIAEELIELVYPDRSENVTETVKSVLDFHLEDIVHDALMA